MISRWFDILEPIWSILEWIFSDGVREKKRKVWSDPRSEVLLEYLSKNSEADLRTLCLHAGASELETKTLLTEIGARETLCQQGRRVWTLPE